MVLLRRDEGGDQGGSCSVRQMKVSGLLRQHQAPVRHHILHQPLGFLVDTVHFSLVDFASQAMAVKNGVQKKVFSLASAKPACHAQDAVCHNLFTSAMYLLDAWL